MGKLVIDFEAAQEGRKVSSFELARYHAGELTTERAAEIEAALASDEALRAELEELKADEAAFKTSMPFSRFAADHEARLASRSPLAAAQQWFSEHLWQTVGGFAAATAAAIMLVFAPPAEFTRDSDPTSGIRLKGAARIGFFVQSDDGARWGADGEQLRQGDRIQFAVRDPQTARAMVIVGIDGRGAVSTYASAPVVSGTVKGATDEAARLIDRSLVLDDSLGAERFFVVYGDGDVEALRAQAERAAKELVDSGADLVTAEQLPLTRQDVQQSSVHIVKASADSGGTR
jgi:anti-sigma factor RsiW